MTGKLLVIQCSSVPIIEHKIGRHGGRSWKRQSPLNKPHDDGDDDVPLPP